MARTETTTARTRKPAAIRTTMDVVGADKPARIRKSAEPTPAPKAERKAKVAKQTPAPKATEQGQQAAKPEPKPETPEQALARMQAEQPERWSIVERVTAMGKSGPTRVEIRCSDPQTKQGANKEQVSVCTGKREIAVQDLFQVRRCESCQDRVVKRARRNRAKDKLREAKALLARMGR